MRSNIKAALKGLAILLVGFSLCIYSGNVVAKDSKEITKDPDKLRDLRDASIRLMEIKTEEEQLNDRIKAVEANFKKDFEGSSSYKNGAVSAAESASMMRRSEGVNSLRKDLKRLEEEKSDIVSAFSELDEKVGNKKMFEIIYFANFKNPEAGMEELAEAIEKGIEATLAEYAQSTTQGKISPVPAINPIHNLNVPVN